jgi:DNA topoisomerase-3
MRDENFIRCGEDIVAWASGHLLELCEPEDYDPAYRQWSRETILYVPDEWKLRVKESARGLFSGLKKLIGRLDAKRDIIVNAGDADREGELLICEILDYCGWHGKTERLRINDLNPGAIRRALDCVRDNAEYRGEYMAGQARMRSDWLVGLALTRFVTVSLREAGFDSGVISVGRVQTPALGLVVERDREIQEFVPSPYFDLRAALEFEDGRRITGKWLPDDSRSDYLDAEGRVVSREMASEFASRLYGTSGIVTKAESHKRVTPPPLPYSLSKFQMAASRRYDITYALVHAQKLEEDGRHRDDERDSRIILSGGRRHGARDDIGRSRRPVRCIRCPGDITSAPVPDGGLRRLPAENNQTR